MARLKLPDLSTLRARLLILVLAGVLPLGALSVWTVAASARVAEAQAQDQLTLAASLVAAHQDRLASSARHLLAVITAVPEIRGLQRETCVDYLARLQGSYPIYANIGIFDLRGDILCHAAARQGGFNAADRDFAQTGEAVRLRRVGASNTLTYKGKKIDPPKTKCTQSVTPAVARTTAYAMENVHSPGGTAARAAVGDDIPFIAKTGTSDNAEQNWIMGATTKVATVVWLGNVSGHVALSSVDFTGGRQYNTKQDIYRDIMTVANRQFGGDPFGAPDPNLVKGKSVSVPAIQGLTKEQAQALIESVGLTFTDGGEMDSELPLNTVAKSEPASGEPTAVGGEVKVYFSNHTLVAGPPSTVGMTETLARSTLVAAGWTVGATIELPIPDAQCPIPTPTPMPTPAPTLPRLCPSPSLADGAGVVPG
mgnify:CR=1 FL=1